MIVNTYDFDLSPLSLEITNFTSNKYMYPFLNFSNWSVTGGKVETDSAADSIIGITFGGFDNQRITTRLSYFAPTASGFGDIRTILRMNTTWGSDDDYYYAGYSEGDIFIGKVVDSSFTTLASSTMTLNQDEILETIFEIVGTSLSVQFTNETTLDVETLSVSDSDVPTGGIMGFRSGPGATSTCRCHSFLCEKLRDS